MQWHDQSETIALPPTEALLTALAAADRARLNEIANALPRVVILEACLRTMRDDVDLSHEERGGLLLGRAYAGPGGADPQVVVAERSVASRAFDSTGVSLRMGSEIWNLARPLLKDGMVVVGWYHSHPDLGAFFSETDRTTQRNFFRNPFSLGIVIDPVRNELSAFVGPDSAHVPAENLIITESP
jgi:proteasome lid subunit RPN8/RPN11